MSTLDDSEFSEGTGILTPFPSASQPCGGAAMSLYFPPPTSGPGMSHGAPPSLSREALSVALGRGGLRKKRQQAFA